MAETTSQLPDRGHLLTEQRLGASRDLDALSIEQALRVINDEDTQVAAAVREAIPTIAKLVKQVADGMRRGGRLIYIGAGTSGRLGVLDASECPPTFHCDPGKVVGIICGGDTSLRRSSEGAEDDRDGALGELEKLQVNGRDAVVGITAGGTTPYVLGGLEIARRCGAVTGLVCCVAFGSTRRAALRHEELGHVIEIPVGPEVVTGSTRMKAGTATKMVLNMVTTATMTQLGKVWGNLMVDLRATNAKLRDRGARILTTQCDLSRDQALTLLDRAAGRVKVAMIMARRAVDCEEANRLLEHHGQRLAPIIGRPSDQTPRD